MAGRFFPPWVWALFVLVLDFVSKRWVLMNEEMLRAKVSIIGEFVRFIYVRNPGAAMGLFPVGRKTLISFSILATILLIFYYRSTNPRFKLKLVAMSVILGGAVGNLIDRVFYGGHVVDFIDVGIGTHRFYTFNVADIGVSIGGALFFLCILFEKKEPEPELESEPELAAPDSSQEVDFEQS